MPAFSVEFGPDHGAQMQRFVARQNVLHFQDLVKSAASEEERARAQKLLAEAEEQLRIAEAEATSRPKAG
jgi:hypothetical protein